MNVVQEQLSFAGPLAEVYINQFSAVEQLYESDPGKDDSWTERAAWLDQTEHTRVDRTALAARLREYNRMYNPNPAVRVAIDQLEIPGTAVVVGGQQSGLFTGPLLVVYKAVTILKAAKAASARLNRPVVPVFWIAGEDHDWDEVNHAYVLAPELQVQRIRMHRGAMDRLPVSFTKVTAEAWNKAVSELEQLLPDSEHKAAILEMVRSSSAETDNLTACFAKLIGALFGKYGLVLLDSSDPELRRLEMPVFEQMIRHNDELESAYHETVHEMAGLGYEPSAEVAEGGANLFYIGERERLLLFKREGRFEDRKGKVSFTADELLAELREHPERFSNNVLTRPLMQDSLLPVLGSVLGPGEIAYWGLTRKAFHKLGLRMPLLLPREAFTVVDGTVQKYMSKYQLSWNDVKDAEIFQSKREAWLAAQERMQVDLRFGEVVAAFGELYDPLLVELTELQSGLSRLGAVNREKILHQIEYLRGKAKEALEQIHATGLRHFDRIQLSLFPLNKPQERVYNLFDALNRFGMDWIDGLMDIPYELTGKHRIIYL
ncbi:MAG: bacillithiol biosynthesis cysteine-adding enzyme BshC [Paenibacillus sp.]|uniref:bacillithiol biosynthesis cysteine-adding enzyme BshC n=1 Tax=Paenibacillus sp. TaxID=58172 RepID=UPI00290D982C|nr:bacillithiol biosynthesis cysteine-adding enzyme BshC [Paenibacillus sp.]MDU4698107.1 bacillithiol biosynthesis cysteine-adding enzyme BshC [Paenibacillus sp.]